MNYALMLIHFPPLTRSHFEGVQLALDAGLDGANPIVFRDVCAFCASFCDAMETLSRYVGGRPQ